MANHEGHEGNREPATAGLPRRAGTGRRGTEKIAFWPLALGEDSKRQQIPKDTMSK